MKLADLQNEAKKKLSFKDIAPLMKSLEKLPNIDNLKIDINNCIHIDSHEVLDNDTQKIIHDTLWQMRPWRKGPFRVFDTFVDTEWQSFIKYNLIEPFIDIKNKHVADIGCNNGYYLFRMLTQNPASLTGFDPSALCYAQFCAINHFIKAQITYELLGVEHLPFYNRSFDVIFCLGVIYHRSDPIQMLKNLRSKLNKNGEIILDTFMIEGDEPVSLSPGKTYAKIPNVYFVPTYNALVKWCQKAGFSDVEFLASKVTDLNEQRKTNWIHGESLGDFLNPSNPNKTIEGYDAPKRLYVKIKN